MNVKIKALPFLVVVLGMVGAAQAATVAPAPGIDEKRVEDITRSTAGSVVVVEVRNGIRKVAAGVVIDKDGSIVTTALVSPRQEEITVIALNGKRYKAEFKGLDTVTGIAVVQVKEKSLVPIALGRSADLRPGAWIGVVSLSPENTPAVTQGIVSSAAADKARLNVWVVPGTSGAAVVNAEGRMVGLLRGTYFDNAPVVFEFREGTTVGSGYAMSRGESPSAGMALAIPVDVVASVSADIRKSGKVSRGWLGVTVEEADGKLVVVEIGTKSPAEAAKLKTGDTILKLDGKELAGGASMTDEIRSRKPGTDIRLGIERDGKSQEVKVKLGEYTEENARRELEVRFPQLFPSTKFRTAKPAPNLLRTEPFRWEKRRYLGATLGEMNKELAEAWGAKDGYGLLIAAMDENGPAKKAGLKVGDIVLKADGRKVETINELSEMLQDKKKGDKIKLEIVREKRTLTLDVAVAEDERTGNFLLRESKSGSWVPLLGDEIRNLESEYFDSLKSFGTERTERINKINQELQRYAEKNTPSRKDLAKTAKSPKIIRWI